MTPGRDYATVTLAYWGFTLTDGALRMLVLLHFHTLGFSPLEIASLFLLYEAMGIVTNFIGGWIGARFGLRITLFAGLGIQIGALLMLSRLDPGWAAAVSVAYVMVAQAMSGIAKDLTKMSSKSAVKLVVKAGDEGGLFKWVAMLTGSKNALKGVGFFLGGFLLAAFGFTGALYAMAGALVLVLLAAIAGVRADLGRAKAAIRGRDLFSKDRNINFLSAARIFLFASRDTWFVVALPIFLVEVLGWGFSQTGGFMALWVIGYGMVQAATPGLLRASGTAAPGHVPTLAKLWVLVLAGVTAALAFSIAPGSLGLTGDQSGMLLIGGLMVFGVVFAINSSIHSYLIVGYSDADKVALNVGFYYMANAAGRFGGTVLSGLMYQAGGLTGALWTSALLLACAFLLTLPLGPVGGGLRSRPA